MMQQPGVEALNDASRSPVRTNAAVIRRRAVLCAAVAGVVLFVLLATANGAGYRFGTSDQAFYVPAVIHALDASAFPRDGALIEAEGRYMVIEEIMASLIRATDVPLDVLFLSGYLVSMALVWVGLVLIGNRVFRSPWAVAALAAAFTLRHRIPRTSVNSFEPYFHPRMLAFSLGLLAVAAVLRRRPWLAVGLVAGAAAVHVTTALWFAVLLGVALAILDVQMRRLAFVVAVSAMLLLVWGAAAGSLDAAFTPMDSVWLQAVAAKDSLFATEWPLWAWVANLGLLGLLWWAHLTRRRRGTANAEDRALVWGATALVVLFMVTLPLVAARASFPVQLQVSRVFWLVDVLALVYVLAAITDWRPNRIRAIAMVLIAISVVRGGYVMLIERPERDLFAVTLAESSWQDAMRWIARQQGHAHPHVLADPGHAWKYGTSVRVAAGVDTFLEEVKDSSVSIYSRDVALRVVERTSAIGDFGRMTVEHARALGQQYALDYLVTEAALAMPLLYRNDRFRIYSLRSAQTGVEPLRPAMLVATARCNQLYSLCPWLRTRSQPNRGPGPSAPGVLPRRVAEISWWR